MITLNQMAESQPLSEATIHQLHASLKCMQHKIAETSETIGDLQKRKAMGIKTVPIDSLIAVFAAVRLLYECQVGEWKSLLQTIEIEGE